MEISSRCSVSVTVKSTGANARCSTVCEARSSKTPSVAPLEPDQAGLEHGDPVAVALDHVGRVRDGLGLDAEVFLHRVVSSPTLPSRRVSWMRSATRVGFTRGWR